MSLDELLDEDTLIDRSQVEWLLNAHPGEGWHCDDGQTFTNDEGEQIVTPNLAGEYPSHKVMHWLGY